MSAFAAFATLFTIIYEFILSAKHLRISSTTAQFIETQSELQYGRVQLPKRRSCSLFGKCKMCHDIPFINDALWCLRDVPAKNVMQKMTIPPVCLCVLHIVYNQLTDRKADQGLTNHQSLKVIKYILTLTRISSNNGTVRR